jgi:hypothetical protein
VGTVNGHSGILLNVGLQLRTGVFCHGSSDDLLLLKLGIRIVSTPKEALRILYGEVKANPPYPAG